MASFTALPPNEPTSGPDRRTSTPLPAAWSGARSGPDPLWTPDGLDQPPDWHRAPGDPPEASLRTAGRPDRRTSHCWSRAKSSPDQRLLLG